MFNYRQETGRAGRDGAVAKCHLIFSPEDLSRQASLMNSNKLGLVQVYALLGRVFRSARKAACERASRGLGHLNDADFETLLPYTDTSGSNREMYALRLERQVFVPLTDLEDLDISDTVAETLLAILELPPYNLLQVEPRVRNLVTGRLRFQPVFLPDRVLDMTGIMFKRLDHRSKETLQVILDLAAVMAANGSRPPDASIPQSLSHKTAAKAKSWYDGSDSDSVDSEIDISHTRSAASSTYDPCRFHILLSDLCLMLKRPREEVTLSLYILQKNSLIEYNLALPSLGVCVLAQVCEKGIHEPTADELMDFCIDSFIYELSCRVTESLETMSSIELSRLVDMWRVGCAIADSTSSGDVSAEPQVAIRDMLSDYIEHDVTVAGSPPTAIVTVPLCSSSATFKQYVCLQECPGAVFVEPTSSDLESLRQEILLLSRDPRLATVVKSVVLRAQMSNTASHESRRADAILRMRSLYIAKVLHGLGSLQLPASQGREFFGSWGRYSSQTLFGFVVNFAYNTLRLLG